MPLTSHQRRVYEISFELKLRRVSGVAFQDLFSTILETRHGADFQRVRAMGSLGDKGCDGYLQSNGRVYQCYGKSEDAGLNTTTLVKKLNNDYALACKHLGTIMKEWHFGHNLVNGVPTEFVLAVEALRAAHPHHVIGVIAPAALKDLVFELDDLALAGLLGPAATAEDNQDLRLEEVAALVSYLMASIDEGTAPVADPLPVPVNKIEFNQLPRCWRGMIEGGMKNAPYIAQYLSSHPDPETGKKLALAFGDRYQALKQQSFSPGQIMDSLYEQITGIGSVTVVRQVASVAILAHLFESCDIFEDHPSKVTA